MDGLPEPPAFSVPYRLPSQELPSFVLMDFPAAVIQQMYTTVLYCILTSDHHPSRARSLKEGMEAIVVWYSLNLLIIALKINDSLIFKAQF
jgi:hypothetical protein